MSFFDTSQETRSDANSYLDQARSMFDTGKMNQDASWYRSQVAPLIARMQQYQTLAGTMGARSAQARLRRILGSGSGVGDAGIGFELGAGFGPASTMAYQAMMDSLQFSERQATSRAGVYGQMAQAVLMTPKKSGWDITRELAGMAGSLASAFAGNPFAAGTNMSPVSGAGPMGTPLAPGTPGAPAPFAPTAGSFPSPDPGAYSNWGR